MRNKTHEEEEMIVEKEDKYNNEYYLRILNKERYIILYNAIEPCLTDMVVTKIRAMNVIDEKTPIILEINSPGGLISCGYSIINAIEYSKAPIHTIISGEACSMAALIAISGKERAMYKNSYIMFHPLSEGQADYLQYIKDRTAFLVQLEKNMNEMCKKHTKFTSADLKKMASGELWLNSEQALAKGVIDNIIK